jgi:alginate O-acetyltransferase complex protein AlgI
MFETISHFVQRLPSTEFFSGAPFWAYFVLVVIAVRLLPVRGVARDLALLFANVLMLLALPRFNGTALALYAGLVVSTYGIGRALIGDSVKNIRYRLGLAVVGVVAVLFVLAIFKYRLLQSLLVRNSSVFGQGAANFIFLIGISYSSFKAIHFIVEAYKRKIEGLRFLEFGNYLLFFPSFVSGPINRYNDFHQSSEVASKTSLRADALPGLERIVHGLFKKFVITVILFPHTIVQLKTPLAELAPWQILLGLYAYALYFYFDFSGYTDLAIGSARLLGFNLPENFNLPFLKKNIQQLWANWHMSLTGWLTDYVYWPLVRKMRSMDFLRQHPLVISNTAIIITFFLCGAWHGESVNFILWGLYHGIGIAIVNVYQKWKRQVRNALALKYFASRLSYAVGVFLTFNFFAMGLLFLVDSRQVAAVVQRFF